MAKRIIGAAEDFYRLRVSSLDDPGEPELEWRDDVLYRDLRRDVPADALSHTVEAVLLEDPDVVTPIARFETGAQAYEALEGIAEDLKELTKSQFEARYFDQ